MHAYVNHKLSLLLEYSFLSLSLFRSFFVFWKYFTFYTFSKISAVHLIPDILSHFHSSTFPLFLSFLNVASPSLFLSLFVLLISTRKLVENYFTFLQFVANLLSGLLTPKRAGVSTAGDPFENDPLVELAGFWFFS